MNKFKNYPTIEVIKSKKKEDQTFSSNFFSFEVVLNKIKKLQTATTIQQNDTPTKITKKI